MSDPVVLSEITNLAMRTISEKVYPDLSRVETSFFRQRSFSETSEQF